MDNLSSDAAAASEREQNRGQTQQVQTGVETAKEEAAKLKRGASEQAAASIKTTKSNIKEVAREATDFGQSVVTEQKEKLAEIVHEYGQAAKAASERLDQEGHAALANRADELSSRLDRASTYLREKRVSEIYYDTEHFARRRPEIVFGMMFAVGLVAARFLKASDRGVGGRRQLNIASEEYPYHPSARASTVSPESENTREQI
jgi:hypothetical protein